ncbi:MAG TPA: fibronectin type III domain-containing protein, partial [Acidimicrobiales bacterium]
GAQTAQLTIPVQIGAVTPVVRCPSTTRLTVIAGAKNGTRFPIESLCHVWMPTAAEADALTYRLAWDKSALPEVSFRNNGTAAPVVLASHNAKSGAQATLRVTVPGYPKVTSTILVIVETPPKLTIAPILVQGLHQGTTTSIDLAKYVNSPYGIDAVSILSADQTGGDLKAAVSHGATTIEITPNANSHDRLAFRFTVTDVADRTRTDRQVIGTIVIQVLGRPDAPTAVTPRPGLRSHEAILTWVAPAANGSPITGYEVDYRSHLGTGTQACAASPCAVTGLTNNVAYTFQVRARNAVNWGPLSNPPSAAATPDAPPPVVTGFRSSDPEDHTITLSWDEDKPDGSPASYLITWPGGSKTVPSESTLTITITGLDNVGTKFAIIAKNTAGVSPAPATTTGWPAGAPAAPARLAIGYVNDAGAKTRTVQLTWAPDPANGQGPTTYSVTRDPGGAVICTEHDRTATSCTDQPPTGHEYVYSVTATNFAGQSAPKTHTSPASTITDEVSSTPDPMTAVTQKVSESDGDGILDVTFTTGAANGPTSIVNCTYSSGNSVETTCSGSPWTGLDVDGTTKTKTVDGLPANTAITLTLWDCNGGNTGNQSGCTDKVKAANAPTTT